jgi:hypothetical protein
VYSITLEKIGVTKIVHTAKEGKQRSVREAHVQGDGSDRKFVTIVNVI